MEERFDIGDFVKVMDIEGTRYGTIIAFINKNYVNIRCRDFSTATVHISYISHVERFKVGCTLKCEEDSKLYKIEKVNADGTYLALEEKEDHNEAHVLFHSELSYIACTDDYVTFNSHVGELCIGKVTRVDKETGYVDIEYYKQQRKYDGCYNPKSIVEVLSPEEVYNFNSTIYENQLQKETTSVRRTDSTVGSRIYGRRPKATISVGSLSYQKRTGYSKS